MPETKRLFAEQGVTFTDAYATTPTCCPSRATLFSGRYAHNHGVLTSEGRSYKALDHETTVQRYLQDAGYTTALMGKFLNNWHLRTPPYFDHYVIPKYAGRRMYRGNTWSVDGRVVEKKDYTTDFLARRAVRFINSAEGQSEPWFLVINVPAPHKPYLPAGRHRERPVSELVMNPAMTETDRSDKPPYVSEKEVSLDFIREVRALQLRTLLSVDELVADVFGALGEKANETLSIFLSDNGYIWGEHGVNGKRYPYSASVRVPLLLRWPEQVQAGEDARLVGVLDIAPTLLEAAGVSESAEMDGWSLLGSHKRDRILLEYWSRANRPDADWASFLTHSYQYIETYDEGAETFYEYYDLQKDPYQLENMFTAEGQLDRGALAARLAADKVCSGTSGPTACP